ncbi:GNAT family N-acetyltransferase [Ekhidna sp.]|uniref:GNAT family N-acetyltransferase n=1 Tax=Ekhidna sp. TaxID=2608089 RepID=UPI0032EC5713
MAFSIHTSTKKLPNHFSVAYYEKGYFDSHSYSNFHAFSEEHFFIAFDLINNEAISIPRSPFGSIFCKGAQKEAVYFLGKIWQYLRSKGILKVIISHPAEFYSSFVPSQDLLKSGFSLSFRDVNQQIELTSDWEDRIHKMQQRKLQSLKADGFQFRKMKENELETAYKFLTVCRQAQGLQINISLEQLQTQNENLPSKLECFGVFRDEKISALCIAVNVTSDIAYYYLPATSPMFRNQSPMVLLIAGMVDYYREKDFKYLDLGVSSIQGKPQETLMKFKERMGAEVSDKLTLELSL